MRDAATDAWIEEARRADCHAVLGRIRSDAKLKKTSSEFVGPCPSCGGTDRFSINRRKNIWFCRMSQRGGDAISLVEYLNGADFLGAVEVITGRPPPKGSGGTLADAELMAQQAREAEERRVLAERAMNDFRVKEIRRAHDIWTAAGPISGSIAESYLRHRGVNPAPGAKLRCLSNLPYWHFVEDKWQVIHEGPAMVAAIQGRDGGFIGCHCTWIDPSFASRSGKATIAHPVTGEMLDAKKVRGSQKGGRIHLGGLMDAARLVVGEGVETVYSVREAESLETRARTLYWSSVNLGNLGGRARESVVHPTATMKDKAGRIRRQKVPGPVPDLDDHDTLRPPANATEIVLLGDGDSDRFTTRNTLLRFAGRWQRPGVSIRAAWAEDGSDFNDMLRAS